MKLIICGIVIALAMIISGVVLAQTQSTLTVGGFTLNVPSTNPAVTVNAPAQSGTLALKEELPAVQPGTRVFAGQINVNGSASFSGISAPPVCSITPRFTTSATGLQITVIDYVCTAKNN